MSLLGGRGEEEEQEDPSSIHSNRRAEGGLLTLPTSFRSKEGGFDMIGKRRCHGTMGGEHEVLKNYNAGENNIFALQHRISKGDHLMKETRIRLVVPPLRSHERRLLAALIRLECRSFIVDLGNLGFL